MAVRELGNSEGQSQLRFILTVVDGCIETERSVRELLGSGLRQQNIEIFYDHQMPVHADSIGLPSGRLKVTLQYLEDLLGLDASTSMEYEGYWNAGRHILLANVSQDNDAEIAVAVLGKAGSRTGRILGYGHSAKSLAHTV
ncbi:MAG: hypothetical protein J4N86_09635 [Chloroflexi bacterium]|nr:hypothetical protein [Chloroflexota bacterium]MCH9017741.1 hypothetical protein [Chloroflexota bacterium]MCI0788347.1 hypothetical protein [Chloroflexota bacterium]MCI0801556.1 hypothetical protein [Chloroflexota bacterium]MCI0848785.1 hypothetical protein [Chloroflexota bacterium]